MPLTLAHPAAVLPLRRHLPLSALVAGSLSPDFEYPLRLAAVSRFSHTPAGVLYFCVPVGLACLWLFHRVLKRPCALLLPPGVRRRISTSAMHFSFTPAGRLLLIIVALAVGAFTHVAWDSLTHEYGWVVTRWPPLRATLFAGGGHELRVYKLLQYASSLLGLLVVAASFLRRLRTQPEAAAENTVLQKGVRRGVIAGIVSVTLAAAVVAGFSSVASESGLHAARVFAVQSVIAGMIGLAASVCLYSLAWRMAAGRFEQR